MVQKMTAKRVGNIIYELKHFEGDDKYVIYKIDDEVMSDGKMHRIPEEAIFDSEQEAMEYLENLR